jgi:hypothetical protein
MTDHIRAAFERQYITGLSVLAAARATHRRTTDSPYSHPQTELAWTYWMYGYHYRERDRINQITGDIKAGGTD